MSAAMACGVSVAFGSPIGGTIFGLEVTLMSLSAQQYAMEPFGLRRIVYTEQECSYYFPHKNMWRAFFGSVIAVLVVQVLLPPLLPSMHVSSRSLPVRSHSSSIP
jgi:H+/Cl- antiporter ClcA